MFKNSNHNSKMYNHHSIKIGDITDESVFPNITHEELHISMNKYNGNNVNNNI